MTQQTVCDSCREREATRFFVVWDADMLGFVALCEECEPPGRPKGIDRGDVGGAWLPEDFGDA
jgi:hypothetical protein